MPKKLNHDGRIAFRCSKELQLAIENLADDNHMDVADFCRTVFRNVLRRQGRMHELQKGEPLDDDEDFI